MRAVSGAVVAGFLYVLHTGNQWAYLPKEPSFTLHEVLLAELNAASRLDRSGCVVDSCHVRASKRGARRTPRRSTGDEPTPSITGSPMATAPCSRSC